MEWFQYVNLIFSYVKIGTSATRNFLIGLIGNGFLMIAILVLSLIGGYFLAKRYHMKPLSINYLPWTLIISFLIFIILMYI